MARKPILTMEDIAKVAVDIERGNYARVVCVAHGITERTFYNYMQRGKLIHEELQKQKRRLKKSEKLYLAFFQAVTKASAKAEVDAVTILRKHMYESPKAIIDYLERRHRERWGRNVVVGTADLTPETSDEGIDYSNISTEKLEEARRLEEARNRILSGEDIDESLNTFALVEDDDDESEAEDPGTEPMEVEKNVSADDYEDDEIYVPVDEQEFKAEDKPESKPLSIDDDFDLSDYISGKLD